MATVPTFTPAVATTTTDLLFAQHGRPVAYATAASQSVASGGWAALTFGTPALDRDGGFATPTYLIGDTPGLYRVTGQATFAASTAGTVRGVQVLLNGGAVPGGTAEVPVSAVSTGQAVPLPVVYVPATATTDALTFNVMQDTGGSLNVSGALSLEWQGELGTITAPVGLLTSAATSSGPVPTPNTPTVGTLTTSAYLASDGTSQASITVPWVPVTTNTDSSVDVDGDHYEVQYRQTGTSAWTVQQVDWSQSSYTVIGLPLDTSYDFQVRAVNGQGESAVPSAWSSTSTQTTATSSTPPGQPDAPTVAASLIAVQVSHDLGLASGGSYDLPPNMDHLEVHFGTSSGFTPSGLTLVGKLQATRAMMVASIPAIGTFATSSTATVWVKVIAVDANGNRSAASPGASSTATLIDSTHVTSISASQITAGTITAAVVIGGSATFSGALSGATGTFSGSLSAATGTFAGSLSSATGTFSGSLSAASGTFTGSLSGNSISGASISGGTITGATIVGGVVETATSGQRVVLGSSGVVSLVGSSGNSASLYVGSSDQVTLQTAGGYPGLTLTSTGTLQTNNGPLQLGSGTFSTSGALTCSGGGSLYGGSGVTIGTGADAIGIGASGGTLNLYPATINLNNIPGTTASLSLTMSSRRLYYVSSTIKAKVDVQDVTIRSADVLALRPVTYIDRRQYEEAGTLDGLNRHLGMIAEEVADVDSIGPLLVVRDDDGEPMSLVYDRLPVLHQIVLRDLAARVAALETR